MVVTQLCITLYINICIISTFILFLWQADKESEQQFWRKDQSKCTISDLCFFN